MLLDPDYKINNCNWKMAPRLIGRIFISPSISGWTICHVTNICGILKILRMGQHFSEVQFYAYCDKVGYHCLLYMQEGKLIRLDISNFGTRKEMENKNGKIISCDSLTDAKKECFEGLCLENEEDIYLGSEELKKIFEQWRISLNKVSYSKYRKKGIGRLGLSNLKNEKYCVIKGLK